jgi:hypothetical protein
MKTRFLFLVLFIASYGFSQSINDYKAVIIPMKYEFLKSENQYRLQTLTKFDLDKAGFQSFYNNEAIPAEFKDRCSLLYIDVKNESSFLVTKLSIVFKDCYGVEVFKSQIGRSKEKEYGASYAEALNDAFKSINALHYKYSGKAIVDNESKKIVANSEVLTTKVVSEPISSSKVDSNTLYAQATSYGYQLIDSEPKVVMKIYKTSNLNSFMAAKGNVQGVLVAKDNQWFFEYYQNEQLISEKVEVKF